MSMPNTSLKTPAAKKTGSCAEDYADYNLSPPKLPERKRRPFLDAVKAIRNDWKGVLRLEEEDTKLLWIKIRSDGEEAVLPVEFCRILLFLYSRKFAHNTSQAERKEKIKAMMDKNIRKTILQVIAIDGDKDLSHRRVYQDHYIRICLTIHRYFQPAGVSGFATDMSSVRYYLRMQRSGSCFLQAACVALSYLLFTCGHSVPPANASRLIRHHFDDNQLSQYVLRDQGGDSLAIFKILIEKFFDRKIGPKDPSPVYCQDLRREDAVLLTREYLRLGPGLVSKFVVPYNFKCNPPSDELKTKFPCLAPYDDWDEIPDDCAIPAGVARFSTWNEAAEFIPFEAPVDVEMQSIEKDLKTKWEALLSTTDGDTFTDVTKSTSGDSSSEYRELRGERSSSSDFPNTMESGSDCESWSHFLEDNTGENESDSCIESDSSHEIGEGDDDPPLHAMVLLGCRVMGGEMYWLLQNSRAGPCQLIEVSNSYLISSEAYLYFYSNENRAVKPAKEWSMGTSGSFYCPSPVAESSEFERKDCESWSDNLVYPSEYEQKVPSLDDILNSEW